MDIKRKLKEVAKEFDLKFDSKNKFTYLVLSKRQMIIRNFLGGCPDPIYIRHGNKVSKDRPLKLVEYLKTKDFQGDLKKEVGTVISGKELIEEIKLTSKIPDDKIRKEAQEIYNKVRITLGPKNKLSIICKPSKRDLKCFDEVLLHEFVHELMESNRIRPKSWKWNEGLVTYATFLVLNKHKKFKKSPKPRKDEMAHTYDLYTHKVALLLKDVRKPERRKKLILGISKRY